MLARCLLMTASLYDSPPSVLEEAARVVAFARALLEVPLGAQSTSLRPWRASGRARSRPQLLRDR